MKILITGIAGFIGYHLAKRVLALGYSVVGIDNLNAYYNPQLKLDRLNELGLYFKDISSVTPGTEYKAQSLVFYKIDLCNAEELRNLFATHQFNCVINLAAQAGVRYSIDNPSVYIQSNIVGFFNLLECIKNTNKCRLIYASSSSVYGNNKVPFSVNDKTDTPVSIYAATKKANEALANSYASLFGIPCTGLRFFTVYGPWGRPDMAYFSFTNKILANEEISIFNNGDLLRDFTYIDDIIDGIVSILEKEQLKKHDNYFHKIYNIGNNKPVKLLEFVTLLGNLLNKEVKMIMKPMQPGDVYATYADIDDIKADYNFEPKYTINDGLKLFINWYKSYYKIDSIADLN